MTSTGMLALLRDALRDKQEMRARHVAAARFVSAYDANNTYQYVIAREDMHVRWLADAVADLGGQIDAAPAVEVRPSGKGAEAERSLIAADRDHARRFVETWRPRVESIPNARHRTLLNVILGETLEHQRFFEQAVSGRTDLLGRRADGAGTGGGVLGTRWVGGQGF